MGFEDHRIGMWRLIRTGLYIGYRTGLYVGYRTGMYATYHREPSDCISEPRSCNWRFAATYTELLSEPCHTTAMIAPIHVHSRGDSPSTR